MFLASLIFSMILHSVGFEPTSTNTFELESNPLDRSGMNASVRRQTFQIVVIFPVRTCMHACMLTRTYVYIYIVRTYSCSL